MWERVKSFLKDREELARGLEEYQLEQEKAGQPIRQRLSLVNDLLAERQGRRARLLDLYLSGEFSKELVTDRKARLEEIIRALEEESVELISHLKTVTVLTKEQVASLQDFAVAVATGLEIVDEDFEVQRRTRGSWMFRSGWEWRMDKRWSMPGVSWATCLARPTHHHRYAHAAQASPGPEEFVGAYTRTAPSPPIGH